MRTKALNSDELASNIFILIAAAYETVSTTLAYCTYILATKPDIQEKLLSEITQNRSDNTNQQNIDNVDMNLSYLDMFVREVLRMYPITTKAMARECDTTTTVGGYVIEKGLLKNSKTLSMNSIFLL